MKISNITAIVTGGASGLGAATAARLSQLGAKVVVFDLPAQVADATQMRNITYLPVDVTSPAEVEAAVAQAAAGSQPLRAVVNCAGIGPSARMLSRKGPHDLSLFAKIIQVNLVGTFNVATLAAEKIAATVELADGQRGAIVNTASVAAFDGQVGQAAYASSKAGIVGLTLPAARDLAQHGIRVNTIAPGILETPMLATVSEEFRAALASSIPFPQRLGRPDEYADLATFLIEHDYLNGETIRLDGALRMAPR